MVMQDHHQLRQKDLTQASSRTEAEPLLKDKRQKTEIPFNRVEQGSCRSSAYLSGRWRGPHIFAQCLFSSVRPSDAGTRNLYLAFARQVTDSIRPAEAAAGSAWQHGIHTRCHASPSQASEAAAGISGYLYPTDFPGRGRPVTATSVPAAPSVTEEAAPSVTEEAAPSVTEEAAPSVTEEAAPSVTEEAAPSVTEEAAPSVTEEAAPSVTEEAAPSVTEEAAPSVTEEAAPSVTEEAAPSVTKEAAPSVTEEAAPSVAEEAAPSDQPEVRDAAAPPDPFVLEDAADTDDQVVEGLLETAECSPGEVSSYRQVLALIRLHYRLDESKQSSEQDWLSGLGRMVDNPGQRKPSLALSRDVALGMELIDKYVEGTLELPKSPRVLQAPAGTEDPEEILCSRRASCRSPLVGRSLATLNQGSANDRSLTAPVVFSQAVASMMEDTSRDIVNVTSWLD
ncbi:uncharacterized protein [Palaemon carinicauda]|uniref:uncharacterized protein n=1 Tax=Palaemon carinicauda TaxID=392227 RepID=UPI0035B5C08E